MRRTREGSSLSGKVAKGSVGKGQLPCSLTTSPQDVTWLSLAESPPTSQRSLLCPSHSLGNASPSPCCSHQLVLPRVSSAPGHASSAKNSGSEQLGHWVTQTAASSQTSSSGACPRGGKLGVQCQDGKPLWCCPHVGQSHPHPPQISSRRWWLCCEHPETLAP